MIRPLVLLRMYRACRSQGASRSNSWRVARHFEYWLRP